MRSFLACTLLSLLPGTVSSGGIEWQASYELALIQAKAENKVVFVAVNMDGERANDRMVKDVYRDKVITKLAAETINLVASNNTHGSGRTCSRFGSISCVDHRQVDVHVRGNVLAPDADGFVIAPQHVFLAPDGTTILSVPYGVSEAELEWCFVTALRSIDEEFPLKMSSKARPPARLVMDGVFEGAGGESSQPLTREEVLELIKELKKGRAGGMQEKIKQLATADEPEAREFLTSILRAGSGRGGRRGGGGRGGEDRRGELLRWIGAHSPPSYWEVAAEFLNAGEEELRVEAVVAMEQLGSPDSLREVSGRVGKEKDPQIKKNLYRALGAVAADDSRARSTLLKRARDGRDELLQANALLALGVLAPDEDIDELLRETVAEEKEDAQVSALLAIGLTRNAEWVEYLEALPKDPTSRRRAKAIEVSLGVLKGAPLSTMEATVMAAGSDRIPRERIFGGTVRRSGGKPGKARRPEGAGEEETVGDGEEADGGL
jgi:hypothetical protein